MLNPKYALPLENLVTELAENMPTYKLAETTVKIEIGRLISQARRRKGINQGDFAKMMHVSQGLVSRWESGTCNFTIERLATICEALNLNLRCPIEEDRNTPCVGVDVKQERRNFPFDISDSSLLEVAA